MQSAPNVSPTFKPVKDASQSLDSSHYIPQSEAIDEEHKPKLAFGMKPGSTTIVQVCDIIKPLDR